MTTDADGVPYARTGKFAVFLERLVGLTLKLVIFCAGLVSIYGIFCYNWCSVKHHRPKPIFPSDSTNISIIGTSCKNSVNTTYMGHLSSIGLESESRHSRIQQPDYGFDIIPESPWSQSDQ